MAARPAAPGRTETAGTRTGTIEAERPRPILSETPAGAKTGTSQERNGEAQAAPAPVIAEPAATKPQHPAPPQRIKAGTFIAALKDLFGKVAQALTGKPTPSFLQRRKQREESKGAFSRAFVLTFRAARRLFHHAANDDEEIQIETERLLRLEIDDYAREQETSQDESEAHYQHAAGLDLRM